MRTLFEKIIAREIPSEILHEDSQCVAIRDISPQAPFHVLVIPKTVIPRLAQSSTEHKELLGHIMFVAGQIGIQYCPKGFRVVINNGHDAGESVPHLHLHVLGGRGLGWPPG